MGVPPPSACQPCRHAAHPRRALQVDKSLHPRGRFFLAGLLGDNRTPRGCSPLGGSPGTPSAPRVQQLWHAPGAEGALASPFAAQEPFPAHEGDSMFSPFAGAAAPAGEGLHSGGGAAQRAAQQQGQQDVGQQESSMDGASESSNAILHRMALGRGGSGGGGGGGAPALAVAAEADAAAAGQAAGARGRLVKALQLSSGRSFVLHPLQSACCRRLAVDTSQSLRASSRACLQPWTRQR